MKHYDLRQVEVRGVKFMVREGTSDIKAVKEVVERRSYRRKGFELEAEGWLDLGANIGAFTCAVASAGSRVVAYEPDPTCFALLEQNVALNKLQNVELIQAAVVAAPQGKSAALHLNSANGNFWRNSLIKQWRGGETVNVPVVGLSELPLGFDCKMDIEGAEMELVESEALPHWRRLVFEWSFDIDPSIARFKAAIAKLRSRYDTVHYSKFDETVERWGASWFPPCRTVWCQ